MLNEQLLSPENQFQSWLFDTATALSAKAVRLLRINDFLAISQSEFRNFRADELQDGVPFKLDLTSMLDETLEESYDREGKKNSHISLKDSKSTNKNFLIEIEMKAPNQSWKIYKTKNDFMALDDFLHRLNNHKIPTLKGMKFIDKDKDNGFEVLNTYLNSVIRNPKMIKELTPIHQFFELSGLNCLVSSNMFFQGYLKKKVGGQYVNSNCIGCLVNSFAGWRNRWFAITNEGICYSKKYSQTTKGAIDMLFFDSTVEIVFNEKKSDRSRIITIFTSSRKLTLKTSSKLQSYIVLNAIKMSLMTSAYVTPNRYTSFSPERFNNMADVYINAEKYYAALYGQLLAANTEVLIRGWWVSPELYLMRPIEKYPESRLDRVLEKLAKK